MSLGSDITLRNRHILGRAPRFYAYAVLCALAMGLTASLGFWQLSRAHAKEAFNAEHVARATLPALNHDEFAYLDQGDQQGWEASLYRHAHLRGRWLPGAAVYLQNRTMNIDGKLRTGFILLMPLALEGSHKNILVQRGWMARNQADMSALPSRAKLTLALEAGAALDSVQSIAVQIAPAPSKYFELGADSAGLIRQNIDLAQYGAELGLSLLPVTALELASTSNAQDGFARNWEQQKLDPSNNYGYSVQWFAMCLACLLLWMWLQIMKPRRAAKQITAPTPLETNT